MAKKVKQATTSKKAEQKKKSQQIEDRTFGLKNKSKSKKVQSYVKSVTHSVNNSGDRKERMEAERRKKQKSDQKERKAAAKEEADALFNEGVLNEKQCLLSRFRIIDLGSQLLGLCTFFLFFFSSVGSTQ